MDDTSHNPQRRITRFCHPDGMTTIFPLDATLEEADMLGPVMEYLHSATYLHALATETLGKMQYLARLN